MEGVRNTDSGANGRAGSCLYDQLGKGELMGSISEGGAMVLRDGSAKVHLPRSRVGTEGRGARVLSSGEEKTMVSSSFRFKCFNT